jgi:TRAP-type mannitol/chloroaromatic compound transport system substrate-binding protein
MISEFEAKNNAHLQTLLKKHKVQLRRFPDSVLGGLKKLSDEVLEEMAADDPVSKKVYESFKKFQKNISTWNQMSESAYHNVISKKYN